MRTAGSSRSGKGAGAGLNLGYGVEGGHTKVNWGLWQMLLTAEQVIWSFGIFLSRRQGKRRRLASQGSRGSGTCMGELS